MSKSKESKPKSREAKEDKSYAIVPSPGEIELAKLGISKALTSCPVAFAIQALMNNAVLPEGKVSISVGDSTVQPQPKFDVSVVGAMRGMLGSKVYRFRCSRASTLTSGTGVLNIATSTDLTQYAEGAALIALFDECRMDYGKMVVQTATVGGANVHFAWIVGFYPSVIAFGSSTPSTVARLDYHLLIPTTLNASPPQPLKWRTPGRSWGFTTDEGVASPRIVSGFNGTWLGTVAGGTPSNSNTYFAYVADVVGSFRSRT